MIIIIIMDYYYCYRDVYYNIIDSRQLGRSWRGIDRWLLWQITEEHNPCEENHVESVRLAPEFLRT